MRALLGRSSLCVCVAIAAATAPAAPAAAAEAFGIEKFENTIVNREGQPVGQAGSHPYAMTTTIMFNHHYDEYLHKIQPTANSEVPYGDPKSLEVNLPAGLIVDPMATEERCTEADLETYQCPNASAVGVVTIYQGTAVSGGVLTAPVYNMAPQPGVPGELGFNAAGAVTVHIAGSVRTGSDYGVTARVSEITQKLPIDGSTLTLWGEPSAESHDAERGKCFEAGGHGSCLVPRTGRTFLTLPSACSGPLTATVRAQSWQEPDTWTPLVRSSPPMDAIEGCGLLPFAPEPTSKEQPRLIEACPEPATEGEMCPKSATVTADSPSGFGVKLSLPQREVPWPRDKEERLAEANLRDAVLTLPAGMAVNPSAANGLGACTPEEIGLDDAQEPSCPDDSKLANVKVETPLLDEPLEGALYLAQQGNLPGNGSNPFESLLAVYLVAEGEYHRADRSTPSDALVKLAGHVEANPVTGQLTTTFENNPQLPFTELKLNFFSGERAALVTPPGCGTYTATAQLTPWSAPFSGPATPDSSFTISSGCGGGFAPSFSAGMEGTQAGASSSFSATFSRQDGEQRLGAVQLRMGPGLLGKIAGVPLCGEAQANGGECGEASLLGEATVAAGAGEHPYWVTGGRVYLTGPYRGQPFGLSIVMPTSAGPFTLTGNAGVGREVVRAAIGIDPHTAQVTVTSDAMPTILEGIPLDLRTIHVTVDRPGFMRNPTSCAPSQVTGTLVSAEGASANVESRFAVGGCEALAFKPSFKVSTQGSASKADGASLDVKVVQKPGEANIAKVDVQLPTALPAWLKTLQQACTEAQFAANPAGCPAGSFVGVASASTPLLSAPLTGPAILVSHGGAAFPDLVIVLQGEGVTIELTGNTDIKGTITYSKFETVPDAPISAFELKLPEGPHHLLAANLPAQAKYSFCGQTMTMPTTITAQDGARVTQTTRIAVTGCARKTDYTDKKIRKPHAGLPKQRRGAVSR